MSTLCLVSEGDFLFTIKVSIFQYFEAERRRDKREKERKKRTHLLKQFHENTCFIFARNQRERTMICAHAKQETHTARKRLFIFYCADSETEQCYASCTLHQRLTDVDALTKKTKTHGWYSWIH